MKFICVDTYVNSRQRLSDKKWNCSKFSHTNVNDFYSAIFRKLKVVLMKIQVFFASVGIKLTNPFFWQTKL